MCNCASSNFPININTRACWLTNSNLRNGTHNIHHPHTQNTYIFLVHLHLEEIAALFESPLFDARLHRHRFLRMQGNFNFRFPSLFGFICYVCSMLMYTTLCHVVYRYMNLLYCIHVCFTCFSYRLCIHWYKY